MDKKVEVKSTVNAIVGINNPDLKLKVEWTKKGTVRRIPFEKLEDALYEQGVEYLFKQGILVIDDLEMKKALGLEPEDAEKPVNIIILSDEEKKRYLTVMPTFEFKKEVPKLPREQIIDLASFAVEHGYADFDKAEVLKKLVNIDIIKAIQLQKQNEEK